MATNGWRGSDAVQVAALRERVQHLETALETRTVICRAQGILMAKLGIDDETAHKYLVRISNDTNARLYDLAAEIVRTRELPR